MITDTELEKLEALSRSATPGPWVYDSQHNEITTPTTDAGQYWLIVSECRSAPDQTAERDRFGHHYDANYALMVQSRNALPDLLATIRELKARVAALEEYGDIPLGAVVNHKSPHGGFRVIHAVSWEKRMEANGATLKEALTALSVLQEEVPCPSE